MPRLTHFREQLYFDRVHIFAPILHQGRYFSWRRQPQATEAQRCVQSAIWLQAAAASAQYQNLCDPLYHDTRRSLEGLETMDTNVDSVDIEQVQAWLLLAVYEFMRIDFRRGWMSAGRAFRLIQLMRLHEIDMPSLSLPQGSWIETEEKRRTFWMAYSMDRFVSIRKGWPLTLSEQVVRQPEFLDAAMLG